MAGKDSELKGELVGHTGGIYGLAWDGSSKKILTASGDKTCRSAEKLLRRRGTISDHLPHILFSLRPCHNIYICPIE